jgi:4,5-dihydroxyphthalate decarboxylase
MQMLLVGEIDAAISGPELYEHPEIVPLIPHPEKAEQEWYSKHGIVPLNHALVVQESFSAAHPEAVREILRLLRESRKRAAAANPLLGMLDRHAIRKSLGLIMRYAVQQKLIPEALDIDELFDASMADLGRSVAEPAEKG